MTTIAPTFSDFFRSFYYSNTYLSPVDLSKKALSNHLLEKENPEAAAIAQKLISHPEVQQVLSEPLTYDPKSIYEINTLLEKHDFTILSIKKIFGQVIPFYSVIEHKDLPLWIIKSGAARIKEEEFKVGRGNDRNEVIFFTEEDSLLRIEMANRIAKAAKEANIEVVIPKKKLVSYAQVDGVTGPNKKYCVVCEKIDILSVEDTLGAIRNMDQEHQREIAKKISTVVRKAGFVDATFYNIRLTPEGKLAFIDTEPAGLMVGKNQGSCKRSKGASVEKCARIGLYTLMKETAKAVKPTEEGQNPDSFTPFYLQIKSDYEEIATPKLSKWKIALSVFSLGLIPLIQTIIALVKTKWAQKSFKELSEMRTAEDEKEKTYINEQVSNNSDFNKMIFSSKKEQEKYRRPLEIRAKLHMANEPFAQDFQQKYAPLAKRFYAYIEDAPCAEALA